MRRIIIDTQSNRLFHGIRREHSYDQRGGLCLVGEGHAVVTTDPIDPEYIQYWRELGFTIPHLIVAGPFDPACSLSDLIMRNDHVQEEIKAFAGEGSARIEFFCVEECEAALSRLLGIPAYCNLDFSIRFSHKLSFKEICSSIGLPTPSWVYRRDREVLLGEGRRLLGLHVPLIMKVNDGMGGMSCGSVRRIETIRELEDAFDAMSKPGAEFLLEHLITEKIAEVAVHWEIGEDRDVEIIGIFDQISRNCSYDGAAFPSEIPPPLADRIRRHLMEKLVPYLIRQDARGYFCCDILVDRQGVPLWTDFNPRRGATFYAWEAVRRLAEIRLGSAKCSFHHEHIDMAATSTGEKSSFRKVADRLFDILAPGGRPFVLVTNPGVIPFGSVDITAISVNSRQEAREVLEEARRRLTRSPM